MAVNLSPIEMARQLSARNQGGNSNTSYFSLKDGETKGIRFLTAMVPMTVVSHSCGIKHIDIKSEEFELARMTGNPVLCPQCGQPLTEGDIEFERPAVEGALMHRFVSTSDPKRSAHFVCLSNQSNIDLGLSDGNYQCPICNSQENMGKNGKPKSPSMRVYGVAVERELKTEIQVINGIKVPVTTGAVDVMVTEDDGSVHPKVVIVDMGYKSFWSKLYNFSQDYSNSICYYDWEVSRSGEGLNTTYSIQCMNKDNPTVVDYDLYKEYIPDIHSMLSHMAEPSYYVKNGWNIAGYVSDQGSQVNGGLANAQNMMSNMGGYQQAQNVNYAPPMGQPNFNSQQPVAGGYNWSDVQNQLAR